MAKIGIAERLYVLKQLNGDFLKNLMISGSFEGLKASSIRNMLRKNMDCDLSRRGVYYLLSSLYDQGLVKKKGNYWTITKKGSTKIRTLTEEAGHRIEEEERKLYFLKKSIS